MRSSHRSSTPRRVFAIMAPSLAAAAGCSMALVLLLGTAPAAQAAPCAPSGLGLQIPGCNSATTGGTVPTAANARQKLTPGAPIAQDAPCARGDSGTAMTGCNAGAMGSIVPGMPNMRQLLPGMGFANTRQNGGPDMGGMQRDPCAPGMHDSGMHDTGNHDPGIRHPGMSGCNAGAAGAMFQGVASFMQMMTPAAPIPIPGPTASPPH